MVVVVTYDAQCNAGLGLPWKSGRTEGFWHDSVGWWGWQW